MDQPSAGTPDYGNWMPARTIYAAGLLGLLFAAGALIFPPLAVIAVLIFLAAAYLEYTRRLLASGSGGVQQKIRGLVLAHLDWDGQGQALDIGCGNGALTTALAGTYPQARVTGIDYWGTSWEYSKSVCEKNAGIEGVAARVMFDKASASALPFADEHFDAVVSNLVFHDVNDSKDKREVIREALRVVKKGGRFAFQDLFLMKSIYGDPQELVAAVRSWGISQVEFVPTRDSDFIPAALKLPFMFGSIGILSGRK